MIFGMTIFGLMIFGMTTFGRTIFGLTIFGMMIFGMTIFGGSFGSLGPTFGGISLGSFGAGIFDSPHIEHSLTKRVGQIREMCRKLKSVSPALTHL